MDSADVGTIAAGFIDDIGGILTDNLPTVLVFVAALVGLFFLIRMVKRAVR